MAEVKRQDFPFLKFNGGLNTTSTPISLEPTDSVDMSNVDVNLSGSVSRRGGITFIGEKSAGGFYFSPAIDYTDQGSYINPAPNGSPFTVLDSSGVFRNYYILHVEDNLYVYDFSSVANLAEIDSPIQTINISTYVTSPLNKYHRTSFQTDRNKLFLLNKYISFGYLFLNSSDVLEFTPVTVAVRDLEIDDPDADSVVSEGGKRYQCIRPHTADASNQPGSGADWKLYWVLYGANVDSTAWASGTDYTSNIVDTTNKFTTFTFGSGRVWLSGVAEQPNTIFFSQVVDNDLKYGRMYQFADPLNPDDSETVATDGGTIELNGAKRILSLVGYKNGVLVFCDNGLWYISGSSGAAFAANAFDVEQTSEDGIIGANAVATVGESVVYYGYGAVWQINRDEIYGTIKPKEISLKIEELYTTIPIQNRAAGQAFYNANQHKLYFLTNFSTNSWIATQNPYSQSAGFRDMLILDTRLGAWYKYSLSGDTDGTKVNIAAGESFPLPSISSTFVITNNGDQVVDESSNLVVSDAIPGGASEYLNLLIFVKRNGATGASFSLGLTDNTILEDFHLSDEDKEEYSSYLLTAHQTFQDLAHKKQSPYIHFIFKHTESGVLNEEGQDITEGSCLFTPIFDFASSNKSNKYGASREVYRPFKWNIGYWGGVDEGIQLVRTKERVRGRGNAIQLRLESSGTKPFELYGFQLEINVSERL